LKTRAALDDRRTRSLPKTRASGGERLAGAPGSLPETRASGTATCGGATRPPSRGRALV